MKLRDRKQDIYINHVADVDMFGFPLRKQLRHCLPPNSRRMIYTFNYSTCKLCEGAKWFGKNRCKACDGQGTHWSYISPDEQQLFRNAWFNK